MIDAEELKDIVTMKINCAICFRSLAPTDRGIFVHGRVPICEKCAQDVWEQMEEKK